MSSTRIPDDEDLGEGQNDQLLGARMMVGEVANWVDTAHEAIDLSHPGLNNHTSARLTEVKLMLEYLSSLLEALNPERG